MPISTRLKVLALIEVAAAVSALGADRSAYKNFNLPSVAARSPELVGKAYETSRFKMGPKKIRLEANGSLSAQQFFAAKEAFLSEKRDEAIKLLRQQIDSGSKENLENMLLNLGQLYAEKYSEVSFLENEVYTAALRDFEEKKNNNKKPKVPKLENGRSREYLAKALKVFYDLEKKYPKHQKIDEVYYFIGFVELENGNTAKGILYLEKVARQFPDSRKFDDAVVHLADHYFDKTDFRSALIKYQILAIRKKSALHDYATYKTSWCQLNQGQAKEGLSTLKGLIDRLQNSDEKAKFSLREQALKDLVIFYGETGSVDEVKAYFLAKMSKDQALKQLRFLADVLRTKARDTEAVKAYTELLKEDPNNPDGPAIELGIYESLTRVANSAEAIKHLVTAMDRYGETSEFAKNDPSRVKEVQENIKNEAFRAATFFHAAAQKSKGGPQLTYALSLYDALLRDFPSHPQKKNILFYRAEILYNQGKWLAAAEAYLDTAKLAPKDKLTDESVYNALLALDQLTAKGNQIEKFEAKDMENASPREIPEAEKKFVEVGSLYLKEYPKGQRLPEVYFRMGSIYYRYHHFDKAIEIFKEIPTRFPKHPSAVTAAHIIVDVHNLKKDYVALDEAAQKYASTPGLGDAEFKAEMHRIRSEIEFKKIESLEKEGKWKEASTAYFKSYASSPGSKLAEQALNNAVVSAEKAGDSVKHAELTTLFLSKFPTSSYAQKMLLRAADSAEKRYDFKVAQKLFENYYQKYPKDKEAKNALYNAAVFADLLQNRDKALKLYDEYLKHHFANPEEERSIQMNQVLIYRKQGNWNEISKAFRKLASKASSTEARVGYLAEWASLLERSGKTNEKNQAVKEIKAVLGSKKSAKLSGAALKYLAEALFKDTEKLKTDFDQVTLKFPAESLVQNIKKKQNRLGRLSKAYDDVIAVGVPQWGVAALSEKAGSYERFVKNLKSVQIPKNYNVEVRQDAEKGLKEIEQTVAAPLEKSAEELFKACSEKAIEFSVPGSFAKTCHDNLAAKAGKKSFYSGLVPEPNYWSYRPFGVEVSTR